MNAIQHELCKIEQDGTRFRATTTLGTRRIESDWHGDGWTAYKQLRLRVTNALNGDAGGPYTDVNGNELVIGTDYLCEMYSGPDRVLRWIGDGQFSDEDGIYELTGDVRWAKEGR